LVVFDGVALPASNSTGFPWSHCMHSRIVGRVGLPSRSNFVHVVHTFLCRRALLKLEGHGGFRERFSGFLRLQGVDEDFANFPKRFPGSPAYMTGDRQLGQATGEVAGVKRCLAVMIGTDCATGS